MTSVYTLENHLINILTGCIASVALLAGCATTPADTDTGAVETPVAAPSHGAHMNHARPDELGRLLYGMEHSADEAMLDEIRVKGLFPGASSNEQILTMMNNMGSNYTWPASDESLRGDSGILILAHGFGDHGDQVLREQMLGTGTEVPISFAFGMSMMMSDHIQLGLDDLTDSGVRDIVVIPAVSTRHNTLKRQWDYVFALQDEPEYASVPRVSSNARLHFAKPLEDHPLVGEIIADYSAEISQNPPVEEVIIVGHGPVDAGDNQQQLDMMNNLADYVRESADYAAVHVATLQDDAPVEVRRANVNRLRELITKASEAGRNTLVVTNLLGTRMVQSSLRRDLRGLGYRFNFKGLIQHDNFIEWINASAQEKLAAIK
ncbi:MAG: hypothetical protein QF790_03465 [Gammaproteobacteria bacterium]|jgi:hypothetical protein|nr:hypothetical protein [Gammaproteobacteria bacterium]MDP6616208.1 hypothetical protein [Gammaproteobacteria bacterium]MDP6695584.1 hypothetical protein [Gammaproteobacteria bacterium]